MLFSDYYRSGRTSLPFAAQSARVAVVETSTVRPLRLSPRSSMKVRRQEAKVDQLNRLDPVGQIRKLAVHDSFLRESCPAGAGRSRARLEEYQFLGTNQKSNARGDTVTARIP